MPALLIFAGNTAIIGSYHVFLALSRMEFFPKFVQQRNTLTCVGLDIIRHRERKAARAERVSTQSRTSSLPNSATANEIQKDITTTTVASSSLLEGIDTRKVQADAPSPYTGRMVLDLWHTCKFYLGFLTTALVLLAWTTNLVAKPMATIFGGSVTLLWMGIASFTYARKKQQGHVPVPITHGEEHLLPGSILAVLIADNTHNEAVIRSAIDNAHGKPVTFLYLGHATPYKEPRLFEFHDPYYDDQRARNTFGTAEHLARKAKIARRFVYRLQEPEVVERIWRVVHPHDVVISSENTSLLGEINPDRIRYEVTPDGRIAHLLKSW